MSEKKRVNDKQLIKDDHDERPTDVEPDAFDHGIKKANENVIAQRKIVKAKRPGATTDSTTTTTASTTNSSLFNFNFTPAATPTKSKENGDSESTKKEETTTTTTAASPKTKTTTETVVSPKVTTPEKKTEENKPPQFTFNFGNFTPASATATSPVTTTTTDTTEKPKSTGFNFNFTAPSTAFSISNTPTTNTTSSSSTIPVFSFNAIAAGNTNGGLQFAISNASSTTSAFAKKSKDDEDEEADGEDGDGDDNNDNAQLKDGKEPELKVVMPDVPISTGEEDEETIHEIARAKLYKLENKKDWKEKGVGRLRLKKNKITNKTRIIMRTDGAMKLILNAPLFAGMKIQSLSTSSVNFTGIDEDGQLSTFNIRVGKTDNVNELVDKMNQNKSN